MLETLTQINSPSGREYEISEFIKKTAEKYADEITTDVLGNLIVRKRGNGKKIMAAAHMDEIGVTVTYIEDNGFLRFAPVGGLDIGELAHRRVVFTNGTRGVIGIEEKEEKKSIGYMYIDIGAKTRAGAEAAVQTGDSAVFEGDFFCAGDRVVSKALDDRVGCYILLEVLKNIKNTENDLYFVFTVQEEVGLRGARTAAFGLAPELCIAVDVTDTGDTPGCRSNNVKLGSGAAVKVMDRSVITSPEVRSTLIECAKRRNISYQLEVMTEGGTDAGAVQLSGSGVKTGGISVPVRYIHSPSEQASMADIEACIALLGAYMETED